MNHRRSALRTTVRAALLAPVIAASLTGAPAVADDSAPTRETAPTEAVRKKIAPVIELRLKPRPAPRPAWVLPVDGYRLTGRFGATSQLWSSSHTGLDFAAPEGTPIRAVTGGVVTETGPAGAYGTLTVVTGTDGTSYWYAHQSGTEVVVGQQVSAGQEIGSVGSTGNVTGPHLHLEVRTAADEPQDPEAALAEHGLHA